MHAPAKNLKPSKVSSFINPKIVLFVILIFNCGVLGATQFCKSSVAAAQEVMLTPQEESKQIADDAFILLKHRKDDEALIILKKILLLEPDNLDALWGKAEVLRRRHDYKEAGVLLKKILKRNPNHQPSLISLAYIIYKEDKLNEASELAKRVLFSCPPDKESQALAYMMLGAINSKRALKGGIFCKIRYGIHIKGYFLKAEALAPQLPETHLAIGTFYLCAPILIGGNTDKAIQELEQAVKIAPKFATASARLACAYKNKGNLEKYNYYIKRAKRLDPKNEVLREIKETK